MTSAFIIWNILLLPVFSKDFANYFYTGINGNNTTLKIIKVLGKEHSLPPIPNKQSVLKFVQFQSH